METACTVTCDAPAGIVIGLFRASYSGPEVLPHGFWSTWVPPTSKVSTSWFGRSSPKPEAGPSTLAASVESVAVRATDAGANVNVCGAVVWRLPPKPAKARSWPSRTPTSFDCEPSS